MKFEKATIAFKKYLEDYDINNGSISLKIKHTYKVVALSEYIATKIGLDKENIELAKLIALLHDIGRFEQIKTFNSFNDKFVNHATYGIKVLFEDNLIRNFIDNEKYDEIIKKAIYNHNKLDIEDNLNEIELLHAKIIRDADKLDNFRVNEEESLQNMYPSFYNGESIKDEVISKEVYDEFMSHHLITLKNRKTILDNVVCTIAFIFDLNFKESLIYVKDKNYIDTIIDKVEKENIKNKKIWEEIKITANNYLQDNI